MLWHEVKASSCFYNGTEAGSESAEQLHQQNCQPGIYLNRKHLGALFVALSISLLSLYICLSVSFLPVALPLSPSLSVSLHSLPLPSLSLSPSVPLPSLSLCPLSLILPAQCIYLSMSVFACLHFRPFICPLICYSSVLVLLPFWMPCRFVHFPLSVLFSPHNFLYLNVRSASTELCLSTHLLSVFYRFSESSLVKLKLPTGCTISWRRRNFTHLFLTERNTKRSCEVLPEA